MYSSPKKQLKSGTEQSLESIQTVKIDSSMKWSDKWGLVITEEDLNCNDKEDIENICISEEEKSNQKGKIDFNSRFQLTQKFQNMMNEAELNESEESEEEKNFVAGFGTSKTFSNFYESPSAFNAVPFRNTLWDDRKGYANTTGK